MLFLWYPRCSTCQKAKKWLTAHNKDFTERDITTENPTAEELSTWYKMSGLPINKFFNTSGVLYKEMGLKDKLPNMSDEEKIELLSTNGKLVKRPLLISDDKVLVGFKEPQWEEM